MCFLKNFSSLSSYLTKTVQRERFVMTEMIAKWEENYTGSACKFHSPNCFIGSGVSDSRSRSDGVQLA